MVSASLGKILLIVACVLGVLQGIMILVGGILAAKAKDKDLDDYDINNRYAAVGSMGFDIKYYCGAMRMRPYPINIAERDQECTEFDEMDRGWFKRVYDLCDNDDIDKIYGGTLSPSNRQGLLDSKICDIKGYKYVLAISITSGAGWIISAIVAILAAIMANQIVGFIAGGLFAVFYIVFIVLFALIWHDVRDMKKECVNKLCKKAKKRGKKAAYELFAYSICGFVLIFAAIICCFLGALGFGDSSDDDAGANPSSAKIAEGNNPSEDRVNVGYVGAGGEGATGRGEGGTGRDEGTAGRGGKGGDGKEGEETKQDPKGGSPGKNSPPKKPAGVSLAGKEYLEKFKKLNRYIADKNKMQKYADKKFDQTDKDKSGTLTLREFKDFVVGLMKQKNLPPPSDRKIAALMKRYDTDMNGTLERPEFKQMLLEIFIESREILIMKYAEKKANSWKPAKVPKKKDLSKVGELDKLLKDSDDFYAVLEKIAKEADKNQNSMLDIDEVTEVVSIFCGRYKVPPLNRDEIVEVMYDMERDIVEYDVYDLRMVAYAVLSISRNLVK